MLSDSQHDIDTKNQEANAKDHTELPDAKKTFFKYMDHGIVMLYNGGYMQRKKEQGGNITPAPKQYVLQDPMQRK